VSKIKKKYNNADILILIFCEAFSDYHAFTTECTRVNANNT